MSNLIIWFYLELVISLLFQITWYRYYYGNLFKVILRYDQVSDL